MTIAISLGIFVSVVLLIEGLFYTYHTYLDPKTRQLRRRLRVAAAGSPTKRVQTEQVEILRKRQSSELAWLNELLSRIKKLSVIENTLIQANSHMPLSVFLLLSGVCACVATVIAASYDLGLLAMLGALVAGSMVPYGYMRWKRRKRFLEFQRQLPDALDLIARALRAGHAFSVGMKMVGDEFPDPIGPEMGRAVEEIAFGIDIPEALKNLSRRIECVDLKFFVTALLIQRETGGNLAEIIESISRLIRLRFELLGRVRALSAEGRLSAIVLMALPIILLFGLTWINPEYMDPLYTDPTGQTMLLVAMIWMGIGGLIIKRMVAIKV